MNRPTGNRILLFADHKWRDLPGLVTLKVELETNHGIDVAIAPYTAWWLALLRFRPNVVVLGHHPYGNRNPAIVRAAKEHGAAVAVIPVEGRPNTLEGIEWAAGRDIDVSGVDLWFTWSEVMRDTTLRVSPLSAEQVVVGGVLRFDFYRSPLSDLLPSRSDVASRYGLSPDRPILTWATNFTHAKFADKVEEARQSYSESGTLRFYKDRELDDSIARDHRAQQYALASIRKLLDAVPNLQVLLKPHPSEDVQPYQDFVRDVASESPGRVGLALDCYIWDVLRASDLHVHRLCTTGVEAWVANVPTIDLHSDDYYPWTLRTRSPIQEAAAVDDVVEDFDGLAERVRYYLSGGHPTPEQTRARSEYIRRWFYEIDGRSAQRHAEPLARFLASHHTTPFRPQSRGELRANILINTRRALGLEYADSLRFWHQRPTSNVDMLGQRDRTVSQADVHSWSAKVRGGLATAATRAGDDLQRTNMEPWPSPRVPR